MSWHCPAEVVSWLSCEVPVRTQQVLNRPMTLFGEVTPASSNKVIAIGLQQLGVTASGELSWDMNGTHWFVGSPLEAIPALLKKWVALWSPSCNVSRCLDLSIFWTWSFFKWFQCSLRLVSIFWGHHHSQSQKISKKGERSFHTYPE